ncbi:hypothetical protein ABL78_4964 [Leptomonas seymouri]|uniref:Uncharacterized protein n=1 Tax=Leptomonas seymouri TaxID=5684 RepID=A0A0N1PB83_LEPSE|nr:hypothetical protein ABL78_4964 [Leptomonas seymouri]|eukprot:KPI85962.1 hypothetical protein ABL78_4964 [Leptomonas seymouri]
MPTRLSQAVVDKERRCIDLRDQGGCLTASVLRSLRTFLRNNDFYIHLCVSDNPLCNEVMTEMCALLNRHPYLTSLEAQNIGLQDKDFRFYFGPALISMPRLAFLDLNRNSGLTDKSAEMVARILHETEVESIRLVGTSLSVAGGRVVADAVVNTTSLMNCELPYTVGNAVLDMVEAHIRRNRAHRTRLIEASTRYSKLPVGNNSLPVLPGAKRVEASQAVAAGSTESLERPSTSTVASTSAGRNGTRIRRVSCSQQSVAGCANGDQLWQACISKGRRQPVLRLDSIAAVPVATAPALLPTTAGSCISDCSALPPLTSASTAAMFTPATALNAKGMTPCLCPSLVPPRSLKYPNKPTPDSLDAVTMWDWTDPAMSNALRCLFVLDHQGQALENYRAAAGVPAAVVSEAVRRAKTRNKQPERFPARRGSRSGRTSDTIRLPSL